VIEAVIKGLSSKNTPGPGGFIAELNQIFKEEAIVHKHSQEIVREGTLPNSFYRASTTLIPKPNKDENKRQL
jgi:hypothetical protein